MNFCLDNCTLCPRNCGVDRENSLGYCRSSDKIKIARRALHYWEEPCISGENGSGAVFFSGCNMRCVYCQNKEISQDCFGKEITVERLAEIFFDLQEKGALNINLVTPTHFLPGIKKAITASRKMGMSLPIVYNTSCYEKPEAVRYMQDVVDIWLPDYKYPDIRGAQRYSKAPDYSLWADKALDEMVKICPEPVFSQDGMMEKGVIVRHLVLPGRVEEAKQVIKKIYSKYGNSVYLSIMRQYTPCSDLSLYPEIDRKITEREYREVLNYALDIGVENGFIQEGESADESFIPPFDLEGVI